jgi:tetratricopeptide (TPR) repeat protein
MTEQHKSLPEGWQLFHLGQLPAAIGLAEAATSSPILAPEAQLLLVRCLFEQGRFRQAETICNQMLITLPSNSDLAWEMRLRRAFLQIYLTGNSTPILEASRAALAENQSPRLRGLAQDLLGRAKAIAVVWNLASSSDLVEAKHLLSEAINSYHCSEDSDAALGALLQLGHIHRLSRFPDLAAAKVIFHQAQNQAQTAGNQVRQAEVVLRLAELDFDLATEPKIAEPKIAEPKIQIDSTLYEQVIALYDAVGHVLGSADVLFSLGNRLIDRGFNGNDAVEQALYIYRQEDHLHGIYSSLKALGIWHLRQGQLTEAKNIYDEAIKVAEQMDFPGGQASAYLGFGDYFYRTGDYARALAAYQQAELLSLPPSVQVLVNLILANVYTLMNLPNRAEIACHKAIAILIPAGSSSSLSLAYFILGNILTTKGDWGGAINVWRDGLAIDLARCDVRGQAEKLHCIAQATVMQHYSSNHFPISDAVYEEAMAFYAQAIELLNAGDNEAATVIANIYQLQAQTALTCRRPLDALQYLEPSRNTYAALGLAMQTATTDSLLGLVCHDLGNQGYSDFYIEATRCYERALSYFQNAQMRDMSWKIRFYLADVAFMQSFRRLTGEEQQNYWQEAARWLEEAAADIELVRGRFIEADPVFRENSRLGLVADKEKVYTFAIKLDRKYLQDNRSAFSWLERLKGRVFLDALAVTSLRPPVGVDDKLLNQEQELLSALNHASTQVEVVDLSERLHILWNQMADAPTAIEYISLRRGQPLGWQAVQSLLQQ